MNNMNEADKKIVALHNQGLSVAEIEKKLDPEGTDYYIQRHFIEFVIRKQRPATTPVRGPVATWIENEDGSGFWSDCWVGS